MVHLEVHSNHSMLEGAATVRQIVARAVEHGMRAIALTDTGGLYGAVPFYEAARAAGVRPLLGVKLGSALLLARDLAGYAQLCGLVTAVQLGKADAARLGEWPFDFEPDGLFLVSGDMRLLEQWRGRGFAPLAALTCDGGRPSRYRAGQLHAYARAKGLRPVAVSPVHFLDPAHHRIHRVLSAIRLNTTVDGLAPGDTAPAANWFRPPESMGRLYAEWPDALLNTEWVAEHCEVELELGRPRFPEIPLPPGETPFSLLWKKAFAGAAQRYRPVTPAIMDRLHHELGVIEKLGFAPYFLIVEDIVRFAHARGIPVMGRGSAANSVVAYALGITRADPFKYGLYFERFLNLARTDCPDIDLDLCWRRRDEVVAYVYETHGRDRVAMIASFNTFRARAALREVAKAHGLTEREASDVIRRVPHYGAGDLRRVAAHVPECRGLPLDREPWAGILDAAEHIDGYPRHLALHPCGLVIAPERLTRFVPLQRAAKGFVVTQYDMGPIERLGLVKMDLLGHRSLTVIADTVASIRKNRAVELDIEAVPDADPLTAKLLRAGRTIGCFQIESPAMRGLLPKVRAADTAMLIKALSLIRPGPSGSGMKDRFIARCRGLEETEYLHPAMEPVLRDTFGVMLYQEDILRVAGAVAGMTLAEADGLRRAMSKQRSPREMARHMKTFAGRALGAGVPESAALAIWEQMAQFAAYSYCKAHACTYGEIAYQCAYLKARYTPEFLAAVLSNRGGFYAPHVYLEEAKRLGVEIRPPCVNRSRHEYTAEDDAIRVGFVEVRNLSERGVKGLLDARDAEGSFRSLSSLFERTGIPFSDAEALFQAGALDGLSDANETRMPRPMQLLHLHLLYKNRGPQDKNDCKPLIPDAPAMKIPQFPDYCGRQSSDLQWTALGLLADPHAHPLQYYQALLQEHQLVNSADLPRYDGRQVTAAGWLIAQRRTVLKDGRGLMKFLTLEDPGGTFEAVVFPEPYQQYGHLFTSLGPFLLTGDVRCEHDACALIVHHVERVGRERETTVPTACG